jgi:hypothetical protein
MDSTSLITRENSACGGKDGCTIDVPKFEGKCGGGCKDGCTIDIPKEIRGLYI